MSHAAPESRATEYRAPRTDAERAAVHRSTTLSFRPNDPEAIEHFLSVSDPADLRLQIDHAGRVTGALVRLPMAHYLAGARVPTLGIAAVSVPPEFRGTGAATTMMCAAIAEARAEGFPLATLYASTRALYRKAGFEPAGHLARFRIPLEAIGVRASEPEVRPGAVTDHDDLRACYTSVATRTHGALDRAESLWQRLFLLDGKPREIAVVVEGAGEARAITGYVIYHIQQTPGDMRSQSLRVVDIVFANADAGRRLLAYLSRFATLAHEAVFQCGPAAPILQLLPESAYRCQLLEHWMLRIVDVAGALETRRYARALATVFALEVSDDLIPENNGRFHVAIADGRATVTPGSKAAAPALTLDIRALAPLYTGFLDPRALEKAGVVTGSEDAFDAAAGAFAGPAPSMMDFF